MQTFLPYADFRRTARVLDQRRLGKQRVETLQIIRGLTRPGYGWRHHPAVKMWKGCEEALGAYGLAITDEWRRGGRADTCEGSIRAELASVGIHDVRSQRELRAAKELPAWLGDRRFHRAHQSSLVRKDPDHYRRWFPNVPDDLPYIWPVGPAGP